MHTDEDYKYVAKSLSIKGETKDHMEKGLHLEKLQAK